MVLNVQENESVNVLGTEWDIIYDNKDNDPLLDYNLGYEDHTVKRIVIRADPIDENAHDQEYLRKEVVRHEVIHAFLDECGLADSSHNAWAVDEEMIDWMARVGPKIFQAWADLDVLPNR